MNARKFGWGVLALAVALNGIAYAGLKAVSGSSGGGGGGTVTNTGTLTANRLIVGNGSADVGTLGAAGTSTQVLHGNASGTPTFGAVVLTTDVSGILPVANGGTGTATPITFGTTVTVGGIIYGLSSTSLGVLDAVASGRQLQSAGTLTAPSWGFTAGTYISTSVVSTANSWFTVTAATSTIIVEQCAGGGGGGGTTQAAVQAAVGGGGGSGGYGRKTFTVTPSTGYNYVNGAAGTAGSNAGGSGGDGADSTFVVGATTMTTKGGKGGAGQTAGTGITFLAGGDGGVAGTNGDINTPGMYGGYSGRVSGTAGNSGGGANSYFGSGGKYLVAGASGNPGLGFCAGGGGGAIVNGLPAAAVTGGTATAGVTVIHEYH